MVRLNLKTALFLAGSNVLVEAEDCVLVATMLSISDVPDALCCNSLKAGMLPGVARAVQHSAETESSPAWSMVGGLVASSCTVTEDVEAAVNPTPACGETFLG